MYQQQHYSLAHNQVSYQPPQLLKVNRQIPFIATLYLSDLLRLINDLIFHDPNWPPIPTKLPSDIQKFDGKYGEDPNNHIMSFHIWCSSNSLMDYSIHLSFPVNPHRCNN
jgi:hypothetical protein